ncbi:MAG: isoprenylcysteine carboxylmethyltransferase family protein, partial [Lysobacterales bacterium]
MGRLLILLYGTVCYFLFLGTFLYAIWFVWTMDEPQPAAPLGRALIINTGLLLLFAIQHIVMARQWFKRAWTKIVPQPVERSTYVLLSSLALLALFHLWQPMMSVIWEVETKAAQMVLHGLFAGGILLVLVSTFLIDHFELFGLKQVWNHWRQQ